MRKLAVLAAVASLSACADQPVRYVPNTLPAQTLPTASLPKLFIEEVVDATNGGEFRRNRQAFRMPEGWEPDVDWPQAVRDAFLTELPRLGWPTAATRNQAGARLKVTVENALADGVDAGMHVPVKGTLSLSLILKDAAGSEVWSSQLEGSGKGIIGSGGAPQNGIREAWNNALAAAMGNLGPLLADERPWERLGPSAGAPVAAAAAARPAEAAAPAGPSDVDELPAPRAARHAHAVVIGIEHYREQLPDAQFAARDARLAAEYFKRVLGVPEENLALLINDHATRSDFDKYFSRWLPNRVEKGDEVYVYYSGHGAPNPRTGDAYLVPYDADPAYIDDGGYAIKTMYEQLAKLPAKRIVVAMDSCFSGAGGHSVIAKGARPLVSVQTVDVPANLTVISASAADQISNGFQEQGHGLFTYYLMKGLKAKGDDWRAVYDYLKPEVSKVARRDYNADQDPQWRGAK